MNLDAEGAPHAAPLAPPEWTMEVISEGNFYIAIIRRNAVAMCRVSLSSDDSTAARIRTRLADMARRWIHEYLRRTEEAPGS